MTDDLARMRATEFVLQRYHLTSLHEAQQRLTPTQFEGVLREIAAVEAQITAQAQARSQPQAQPVPTWSAGINTPLGPVLPATGLLLVAIWVVFVLESLQPGGSQSGYVLYTFGATTPDTLATGQYWRLIAACFLHIGIAHILTNSLALFWLGGLAERFYGPLRFLGIYLAAGVGGNVLGVLVQPALGAGASGAIFGLLGAMLIAAWRNRPIIGAETARGLFGYLLRLLVLNIVISFLPGIGWSAHLGGALSGALLALAIPFRSPRYPRTYRLVANALSGVLIVVTLALALTWIGNHPAL